MKKIDLTENTLETIDNIFQKKGEECFVKGRGIKIHDKSEDKSYEIHDSSRIRIIGGKTFINDCLFINSTINTDLSIYQALNENRLLEKEASCIRESEVINSSLAGFEVPTLFTKMGEGVKVFLVAEKDTIINSLIVNTDILSSHVFNSKIFDFYYLDNSYFKNSVIVPTTFNYTSTFSCETTDCVFDNCIILLPKESVFHFKAVDCIFNNCIFVYNVYTFLKTLSFDKKLQKSAELPSEIEKINTFNNCKILSSSVWLGGKSSLELVDSNGVFKPDKYLKVYDIIKKKVMENYKHEIQLD